MARDLDMAYVGVGRESLIVIEEHVMDGGSTLATALPELIGCRYGVRDNGISILGVS